jgi:hypothetical protein
VSFTPRPLHSQGNSPRYPLHRKRDGSKSRYGRGDEEKTSVPLPGIEPNPPARSLVAIATEIS